MSDVQTAVRKRIEELSETEKLHILVVGTEPATFVNSMEMSVTGVWPNLGDSGGGVQDKSRCLNRFDMFPHIEGLSGKVACLGLSLEEKGDMSAAELEQTLRGVHTDVKIDMVVFICPSSDPVPIDVLEGVKRGVDKTSRNVPIFLFMTKQSNRAPTKPMKENMQKAQKDLDIAAEDCRFIQLYQFQTQGSEVSQKTIDQPLLKFWDKILSVKDKDKQEDPKHSVKDEDKQEDLKHCPQWTTDLVDLGISRQHVILLLCVIIALISVVQLWKPVQCPGGNCLPSDTRFAEELQSGLESKILQIKSESVTLNNFDDKVQEMKSEIQTLASELHTLNNKFDGRLQEMKSEILQMKSELLNALNSNFDKRLQEMESKVLGILKSELSNQTTNLTNNFNATLNNLNEDMNNTLADMYSKLDNKLEAFNRKMNENTESTLTTWKKTVDEKSSELNTTWERGLLALKNETERTMIELDNKLVAFSKKTNENTESLNNTLTTLKQTVDEKSLEHNATWERGLLALKKETESMASNLSTELDRKQAIFNGELEARASRWESKQNRGIHVMGRVLQYWRRKFDQTVGTAESKLLNTESKLLNTMQNLERIVTVLNDSIKLADSEGQKEPIEQGYLVLLYDEYPLQTIVTVVGACIVIGWLICSQCNKRGSRRLPLTARRRLGQAPGAYGDTVSDDEEWLDENRQVCIVASLDWTLDEVERCVKAAVQERGLTNTAVLPLRISGQDDIDVLKRTLQRDTRVICCANSTTRNILLSDTEHDEISYVVKAAEKIVGGSGVMVLLYGHEKSRDIQQLYDSTSFDRTFLNKQTRLHNKALGHLFFSVSKSLNDIQKRRICDWIRGNQ